MMPLSQTVALGALSAMLDDIASSLTTYLAHRPYDWAPQRRARCVRTAEGCAQEQQQIQVHVLRVLEAPRVPSPVYL